MKQHAPLFSFDRRGQSADDKMVQRRPILDFVGAAGKWGIDLFRSEVHGSVHMVVVDIVDQINDRNAVFSQRLE